MADAEAICEAAQRPTMRFVAVKSEAKQASGVVFRTRDLLVRQRTQIINALRGHLAEFGISRSRVGRLASSSSSVGISARLQWPRSPRSQPRKARFSNAVSSRSVLARRCSRETA